MLITISISIRANLVVLHSSKDSQPLPFYCHLFSYFALFPFNCKLSFVGRKGRWWGGGLINFYCCHKYFVSIWSDCLDLGLVRSQLGPLLGPGKMSDWKSKLFIIHQIGCDLTRDLDDAAGGAASGAWTGGRPGTENKNRFILQKRNVIK